MGLSTACQKKTTQQVFSLVAVLCVQPVRAVGVCRAHDVFSPLSLISLNRDFLFCRYLVFNCFCFSCPLFKSHYLAQRKIKDDVSLSFLNNQKGEGIKLFNYSLVGFVLKKLFSNFTIFK